MLIYLYITMETMYVCVTVEIILFQSLLVLVCITTQLEEGRGLTLKVSKL